METGRLEDGAAARGGGASRLRAMADAPPLTPAEHDLLESARRAVLATIAPSGRPRLVPITFGFAISLTGDSKKLVLYSPLDEKPKSVADPRRLARVRDVLERPRVTVLVDRWHEDWTQLAWLRLEGDAALIEPAGDRASPRALHAVRDAPPGVSADAAHHGHASDELGARRVNVVDLLALFIVGLAMFFGWRSGFIIQALALGGFLIGIGIVIVAAPSGTELVADMEPWLRTLLVLGIVAAIVLLAQGLGSALGASLRRRLGRGVLGGIDQGLGAAFGMARGVFMVWLLGGLVVLLPSSSLATAARQSLVLRTLETRVPSPVVLAAELGRLFEAAGLPNVLVGAPPPIDVPEDAPGRARAEEIAAAARRSTVRVETIACGRFLSGTAFAVTPDHFVTNAHVVAGAEQAWISFDGALDRLPATVVDFDPSLDAALIHVAGAQVAPLRLAETLPRRGQPAAALGFTGGGRQRLIPGVISRTLSALGRDIYGRAVSAREVIEMRLDVSPGDSGGPVLLDNGEVGGVTFSEAPDNTAVGYALSPVAVAASIRDALESTTPAPTGPCLST
jgi:PPOX class probable F420-dependent enzyme